jgi:hypothetical protein
MSCPIEITNLPARVDAAMKGKPASNARPKQVTARLSIRRWVLRLSSGLTRKPFASQPLATTPSVPATRITLQQVSASNGVFRYHLSKAFELHPPAFFVRCFEELRLKVNKIHMMDFKMIQKEAF